MPPPSFPLLDDEVVVAEDEPLPLADGFFGPDPSVPAELCSRRVELSPPVIQRTGEHGAERRIDAFEMFNAADTLAAA